MVFNKTRYLDPCLKVPFAGLGISFCVEEQRSRLPLPRTRRRKHWSSKRPTRVKRAEILSNQALFIEHDLITGTIYHYMIIINYTYTLLIYQRKPSKRILKLTNKKAPLWRLKRNDEVTTCLCRCPPWYFENCGRCGRNEAREWDGSERGHQLAISTASKARFAYTE